MVDMQRMVGKYLFDAEMNANKMIFLTGPVGLGKQRSQECGWNPSVLRI